MELTDLEIRKLHRELLLPFIKFFHEVLEEDNESFFSPHPFTPEQAEQICSYEGDDMYYALIGNQKLIGYGMLRGWDEGFEVPSLGLYIHKKYRSKGYGSLFMKFLHAAARLRNASEIRIKVHKDNHIAKGLYEFSGYSYKEQEGEFLIGYCEI